MFDKSTSKLNRNISEGTTKQIESIVNTQLSFSFSTPPSTVNNNSGATGIDMIPNFAVSAIATATDLNIVVNYAARDRLSPLRDFTRAEISALIYQTLVAINRAKAIDSPYIV